MDRQIKNRANGIVSTFTQAQWDKIKNDPQWQNTFQDVTPETPKEVQEAKKAAEADAKSQAQPATEKKANTGNNNTNQTK